VTALELNPFQERTLLLPEETDAFLGGGRGGGKSYVLALLALRHAEQYGGAARILYIRRTYKGLADFELITRDLFGTVYGATARYNSAEHVWRLPGGGYLELGQLESHADYSKYQGRTFTLLLVDEAGQYPDPSLLDILRSNLRGPKDVPIRTVIAANPGGVGHYWLAKRFVFKAAPWAPYQEEKSGRLWVYAPSTFAGNQFIDRTQYADQLRASCPDDQELLRAWVDGDWAIARGAYFASVLDESRNAVDPWQAIPGSTGPGYGQGPLAWKTYLTHDFGSSAPSVTYIVAVSPGGEGPDGRFYPRDSLVLVDELATCKRDRPSEGLGWTVPILGEEIVAMCNRWGVRAQGVMDGDPDEESGNDVEDDFELTPAAIERAVREPAVDFADQDAGAYVEWHDKPANLRRHGQGEVLLGHEDDEEDDPAGQCTEDEISCGRPFFGRSGAGCELSDPGGCEHDGREPENEH
jgi:hypothetical protein